MNHEEYREAAALDALDALGEGERGALEEHLRLCPECLREHGEMRAAASLLAYSVEPVAPPERLRAELLERVRVVGATRDVEVGSEVQTLTAGGETARVLRPPPERFTKAGPSTWTRALAYGALAASVLLTVALLFVWRENRALRGEVARLGSEATAARDEVARGREELAREREVAELFAAPESSVTPLQGTKDAPGARASLAYDRASGRSFLIASGLPPTPAGKAYQIWYIAGGKPLPGPTFKTDAAGRGELRGRIPVEGRDAKQFAVTLEPEAGVPAPTGGMYLLGSVLNPSPSDANAKS